MLRTHKQINTRGNFQPQYVLEQKKTFCHWTKSQTNHSFKNKKPTKTQSTIKVKTTWEKKFPSYEQFEIKTSES